MQFKNNNYPYFLFQNLISVEPPIRTELLDFSFPPVKERKLSNGLTLLVIERSDLPKVYIRIGMDFGTKNDPEEKSGLIQLLASSLKKGTEQRDYEQIVNSIETAGGEVGATVNNDFFFIYGEFLKDQLTEGMTILSDITLHPTFPKSEVEKERVKLIADLENEKSSPQFLAHRKMNSVLYAKHPYSAYKTSHSLQSIYRDDLVEFHKSNFMPNRTWMVVAGDISEEEAVEIGEHYFSTWDSKDIPQSSFDLPGEIPRRVVYIVDRPESEQCDLLLGNLLFSRNNPDYETMLVMNKILGGGGSGRLFLHLREEKGYTYGAYSLINANKESGAWLANAEVRTDVAGKSVTAFFDQFQKIKNELVLADDLKNAKRYIMGVFPLQNETPSSIAALALRQKLYELPADYWDHYIESIANIQQADVQKVAQRYINEEKMSIVAVGDAEMLKPQLEDFGEVRVYDSEDNRIE